MWSDELKRECRNCRKGSDIYFQSSALDDFDITRGHLIDDYDPREEFNNFLGHCLVIP
jgi:hypothetical protein